MSTAQVEAMRIRNEQLRQHVPHVPAPLNMTPVLIVSVIAAALGYFVDLFDIVIFGVVRVKSLEALGITGADNTSWGITLLNLQMIGMLVGGFAWGVIGDKMGRRFALLTTILVFSLANIANAFVQTVEQYALFRFLAGFGLAGELGAGITLVSELLPQHRRGYATTLVSFLGLVGAVTAAYVGGYFDWRIAYLLGGGMGLIVLLTRFVGMAESEMYEQQADRNREHGDAASGLRNTILLLVALPLTILFVCLMYAPAALCALAFAFCFAGLFTSWRPFIIRFFAVAAVGIPIWYASALFVNLAPEYGKALGMAEPLKVGNVLLWQAVGLAIGSALSGLISEQIKSRKKIIYLCFGLMAAGIFVLMQLGTVAAYCYAMFAVGLGQGYWTAFITLATEQFGTNIRATVTTAVPNIVRAMTVPVTLSAKALWPAIGLVSATLAIGGVVFGLALFGLYMLKETYGKDLNYTEA